MNKYTYEDYLQKGCLPIGYNEATENYIFSQTVVDKLLKQIRSLEEQLKDSITPKFKIGEYLYSVRPFCGKILCAEGYVTSITQLSDKTIHYHLETKPNELGYKNQYGVEETNCYRTMEEVHKISSKLLAELEGK